jgi:anti-anti-sigma factor
LRLDRIDCLAFLFSESLDYWQDAIVEVLAGGQKNVLLNLAEINLIDSSGLAALIRGYATVSKGGGQMKLLNVQKKVNDIMKMATLLTRSRPSPTKTQPSVVSPGRSRPAP